MADRQPRARVIRALCVAVVVATVGGVGTALAASQAVAISGLSFSPSAVTVSIGDTVTWTNSDAVVHTATADDGSWNAGNIAAGGGTGAVVFTTPGTFPYHCTIHTQMTGTVTVEAAAATAAPTAAASMVATDALPTSGGTGGSGGGWLATLVIAMIAAAVGVAVLRRQPAPAIAGALVIQAAAGRETPTPLADTAPDSRPGGSDDRSLAPIVIVAVASAVAVAIAWRRLTSSR